MVWVVFGGASRWPFGRQTISRTSKRAFDAHHLSRSRGTGRTPAPPCQDGIDARADAGSSEWGLLGGALVDGDGIGAQPHTDRESPTASQSSRSLAPAPGA
jgi:hypothetical protein